MAAAGAASWGLLRACLPALMLALLRLTSAGVGELLESLGEAKPGLKVITEWVRSRGYQFEVHNATTDDRRLLTLFRIPRPGCPAVLMQHGVLDSAWAWVSNENFKALGFQLHDAGYDVWLGNNRGNSFSEHWADGSNAHKSHSFWDFTFDDMAHFDVPAMIGAVLKATDQQKLAYVGHSQGTLQFFIAGSSPELRSAVADRVSVFVALSPVAWLGNVQALLFQALAQLHMLKTLWLLFPYGFLDSVGWRHAAGVLCTATIGVVCKVSIEMVCGVSDLDPPESISAYTDHFPFGTSYKNVLHFAQAVRTGAFRRFDYGSVFGNMKAYGSSTPPEYDLSKMGVPTALLFGERDLLADRPDVDMLVNALGPTEKLFFFKSYKSFSHVTWLMGSREAEYYVGDVLGILREHHGFGASPAAGPAPAPAPAPARSLGSQVDEVDLLI